MTSSVNYVDNQALQQAITAHQAAPSPETAEIICVAVSQIAEGYWQRYARPPLDGGDAIDFAQDCASLAVRWSRRFDPKRGSKAFNFLTTCVANHLRQWGRDDISRRRVLSAYARHIKETTRC